MGSLNVVLSEGKLSSFEDEQSSFGFVPAILFACVLYSVLKPLEPPRKVDLGLGL